MLYINLFFIKGNNQTRIEQLCYTQVVHVGHISGTVYT